MSTGAKQRPIIYFDGVCNLCNGVVQFIIKRDKRGVFLFSSLQSTRGQEVVAELTKQGKAADSIVLAIGDRYLVRSDAALHIARLLGGGWQLFYGFIIVPKAIRDAVYKLIAKNRYRWFGQREECMMMMPGLADRFLSE
jgi:predicted DCC family thiol-disulfide oxidoreductase YuxK